MAEFISNSLSDTRELSKLVSEHINKGSVIAMYGEVGAGKTTFTSSLLNILNSKDIVTSPTFSLINEYKTKYFDVAHFDMYRITDIDDLYSIGFYDYLNSDKVLIIEWSENINGEIPENAISVHIEKINEHTRKFTINGV